MSVLPNRIEDVVIYKEQGVEVLFSHIRGFTLIRDNELYFLSPPYMSWIDFIYNIISLDHFVNARSKITSATIRRFGRPINRLPKGGIKLKYGEFTHDQLLKNKKVSLTTDIFSTSINRGSLSNSFKAPINKLSLTNFRKFKQETFHFSPITLLTGANSSGKSSLFKAYNLFSENIDNDLHPFYLHTRADLGDFKDLLNRNFNNKKCVFTFDDWEFCYKQSNILEASGFLNSITYFNEGEDNLSPTMQISLKETKGDVIVETISFFAPNYLKQIRIDLLRKYNIKEEEASIKGLKEQIKSTSELLESGTSFKYKFSKLEIENFKKKLENKLDAFSKSLKIKEELIRSLHDLIDRIANNLANIFDISEDSVVTFKKADLKIEFTRDIDSLFETFFDQINGTLWDSFISSNHMLFDRITSYYQMEDENEREDEAFNVNRWKRSNNRPIHIVPRRIRFRFSRGFEKFERLFKEGILSIPAVRAQQKRHYLDNDSFGKLLTDFNLKKKKFSLQEMEFLNKWLSEFNIGTHFETKRYGGSTSALIQKDEGLINLSDLGYGITELVPIILSIVLANHNKIEVILIEEPECNLHPNFQSKIADLIVDASKEFGIQFIVETHSEYLIRRTQLLVQEHSVLYHQKIKLYYFTNQNSNISMDKKKQNPDQDRIYEIKYSKQGLFDKKFMDGFLNESALLNYKLQKGIK